jgi:prepilin-type processing-associated H-X9-DG protein
MVLDAVEELRGAGAEAMQIAGGSGEPVRIVASTYFTDSGNGLFVDGHTLTGPYVITVIGDPQTMQPALNIAGGVADTMHQAGGAMFVEQQETVQVTATREASTPRYAQPAS